MKNKLLLTSALAGSLIAGSALAQTSITGDLVLNYRAASFDQSGGAASKRGFGRESQVNIQNKGKLSNGMDYAAGFALEFDGSNGGGSQAEPKAERNTISNENLYFDLISGNTTVTVGVDHMQRVYGGATPQVTDNIDDVNYLGVKTTFLVGANSTESAGIGIIQRNVAGFSLGAYYAPTTGDNGGYDTGLANDPNATPRNSSYELTAIGTDALGVKGLSVALQYNKESKQASANIGDTESKWAGIGYNAGQFAVGYDRIINEKNDAASASATEDKTHRYGITLAAAKDITIGLNQFRTERTVHSSGKDADKEKSTALQIGYNLGPVSAIANISKTENINFVTGADADMITLRLATKF
jgi:hypothetical protein